MGKDEPEQTAHTTEEVGWFHHAWDEVGPQLATGVCSIIGLVMVALVGYLAKRKYDRRH